MRALAAFLALLVISCATFQDPTKTVLQNPPEGWTAFISASDLHAFFEEAYSSDMTGAIVRNDLDAYIVIKTETYTIDMPKRDLDSAIKRYLEAVFDKKRRKWDLQSYRYSIYDGAVLRGESLVATEMWSDVENGVPCDTVSHVLFYPCDSKSCFSFVSMVSLPDATQANIPVLEEVTGDFRKNL